MTTKQQTSLIEQTLLLNQRPRIKVRSVSWVRDYGADKGILTFHLKIANYGGVAARIGDTNFTVYSKAMQAIELPVEPSYKDGYNLIEVPNDLLEAGTSQLVIISYPRELNDWDREAITHGGFYIIGYIKYAGDVKGIRYETAFCRNYSQERGRYLPITNDEYEYED